MEYGCYIPDAKFGVFALVDIDLGRLSVHGLDDTAARTVIAQVSGLLLAL